MVETTQIPEGTWMLSKFIGASVKQMIGFGVATEDAVFIESLKWLDEDKHQLRQMQLVLERGQDQKLHVSELHPVDEHQAVVLAEAARFPNQPTDPEIRAMRQIRGNAQIDIIDAQATEKLKATLPYHFTLAAEDFRPALTLQDSAVYKALSALYEKDDIYRSQVDFSVRPAGEGKYAIDKIELYPAVNHLSPTLRKITEMANSPIEQTEATKSVIVIAGNNLEDLRREAPRHQPDRGRG